MPSLPPAATATAAACPRSAGAAPGRAQRGVTMVELVTVLLLVGVLAAVAAPRLAGMNTLPAAAWRDQVAAGLLHARALAQGHRRLVCASVATGAVQLTLATANPATSCSSALPGPDGDTRWAVDSQQLAVTLTPSGTLYFQPDGRITSDGAGQTPVNVQIAISGATTLNLTGETGHVD